MNKIMHAIRDSAAFTNMKVVKSVKKIQCDTQTGEHERDVTKLNETEQMLLH